MIPAGRVSRFFSSHPPALYVTCTRHISHVITWWSLPSQLLNMTHILSVSDYSAIPGSSFALFKDEGSVVILPLFKCEGSTLPSLCLRVKEVCGYLPFV